MNLPSAHKARYISTVWSWEDRGAMHRKIPPMDRGAMHRKNTTMDRGAMHRKISTNTVLSRKPCEDAGFYQHHQIFSNTNYRW